MFDTSLAGQGRMVLTRHRRGRELFTGAAASDTSRHRVLLPDMRAIGIEHQPDCQ